MKKKIFLLCTFLVPLSIQAKIKIVTTTSDLASITKSIGKNKVQLENLTQGNENLHYLVARPDLILKTSRSDMLILNGLDLEVGWLPIVLKQARNPKIQLGKSGYCDASQKVKVLQKPLGEVNRQMGDVHVAGNPHYWTDPINGIRIAKQITACLSRFDPSNRKFYQRNFQSFSKKLKQLTVKLLKKMKPLFGKSVICFHNEFIYLMKRFRLKTPEYIEEKPGVYPTPARKSYIINYIKKHKIAVVIASPWSNVGLTREIANKSGANLLVLPIQTGSAKNTETYIKMIETSATLLYKNLK